MKVSIITVCFNSEQTIKSTLESVKAQIGKKNFIEYIIIDGGSKDGTLSILDQYREGIDVLISEKDKGIYDAMNKGIAQATGDFILFLNSDDILFDKNVISDFIDYAKKNEYSDYFYGGIVCKNIFGGNSRNLFLKNISEFSFKRGNNNFPFPALFIRRDLFKKLGLLDFNYKVNADYEWECRLVKSRCKGEFFNRIITIYDQTGFSSVGGWSQYVEKLRIINKYFGVFYAGLFLINSLFKFSVVSILKRLKISDRISRYVNRVKGTSRESK